MFLKDSQFLSEIQKKKYVNDDNKGFRNMRYSVQNF